MLITWWQRLTDNTQSKPAYLARALLADLPVTLVIAWLINWATGAQWPTFEAFTLKRVFFVMCVFVPVVETLLMAIVIFALQRAALRPTWVPWVSALIWAVLHSLAEPTWGLGIFWSFVIFSLCFVTWVKKSWWLAIAMTAMLHALHNLFPALLLAAARLWKA